MNKIFNAALLSLLYIIVLSCTTMQNEKTNSKTSGSKSLIPGTESNTMVAKNPVFYGNNGEVQAYRDSNAKIRYITGSVNALNMTDKDILLNTIDLNRIKIKEETLNGKRGIVLAFYDILIFLEEKNGDSAAVVGIFEHQKGAWVFGEDVDNSNKSILIKIDNNGFTGPIKIGTRNISRAYN